MFGTVGSMVPTTLLTLQLYIHLRIMSIESFLALANFVLETFNFNNILDKYQLIDLIHLYCFNAINGVPSRQTYSHQHCRSLRTPEVSNIFE